MDVRVMKQHAEYLHGRIPHNPETVLRSDHAKCDFLSIVVTDIFHLK